MLARRLNAFLENVTVVLTKQHGFRRIYLNDTECSGLYVDIKYRRQYT